jgi:protein TonB
MFGPNRTRGAETGGGSRSRFFPVSLAIHGAGLLAVLAASLWTVQDPPDPPVSITWVSTRPPPPAGGAETTRGLARARTVRGAVVAPASVPDRLAVAASLPEAAEDFETGSGGPGAPSDGDGEGAVDGVEGGTGTRIGDPGPTDQLLRPGGDVHAPVLVRRVEPIYPEAARKARLEGDVVLEAIITSTGEIEEVRIVKSEGPFLDASARDAVERWKYRPATLNGRAVRVLLTVTIRFRLH